MVKPQYSKPENQYLLEQTRAGVSLDKAREAWRKMHATAKESAPKQQVPQAPQSRPQPQAVIPIYLGSKTIYLDPKSPAGRVANSPFGRLLDSLPLPDQGDLGMALATGGMAPGMEAAEGAAENWLQSAGTRVLPSLARYWEPIAKTVVGIGGDVMDAVTNHDYQQGPLTADEVVKGVVTGRAGSAAGGLAQRVVPKGKLQPIIKGVAKKAGATVAGAAYDNATAKKKKATTK